MMTSSQKFERRILQLVLIASDVVFLFLAFELVTHIRLGDALSDLYSNNYLIVICLIIIVNNYVFDLY